MAIYSPLTNKRTAAYYQQPSLPAMTAADGLLYGFGKLHSEKEKSISASSQLLLGALGGIGWALQSNQLAFFQSAEDHQVLFIPAADLDLARDKLLTFLHVNGGLALQKKTRPRGD